MTELNLNVSYSDEDIKTLDWDEHIRRRPGMYIGKLGDGAYADDGIYVLLKEVVDNSIDEFVMGAGQLIEILISTDGEVSVRDYGRGIPLGKLVDATGKMNTGGKIDSKAFKKSVGLNGVGIKAVNALSSYFSVTSRREGQVKTVVYSAGQLKSEGAVEASPEKQGTEVHFIPDKTLFRDYRYNEEYVIAMVKHYVFLNTGLTIIFNGETFSSKDGLADLLKDKMTNEALYPIIHFKDTDIEVVITHTKQYGEEFYSFVNGQYTTQGGTHLTAFRETVARTIKEYYAKNFDYSDIRSGMSAAISIKVEEPVFESQTKTKLGSRDMMPNGITIQKFVGDFIKKELDDYLHMHSETSETMLTKIQESERERRAISGVSKLARERAKKSSLHNKKLRDCRLHLNDPKAKNPELTSIFITEGLSASGSITASRDPNYQAVFSLLGKPLNSFGLTKRVVYENEEFNLLQAALNIEDGIEGLRYNRVIIATDADDDGMHIRLLLLTFFLQFFPDLIRKGHVFVLETPLYRISLPPEINRNAFGGKQQSKRKTKPLDAEAGKSTTKEVKSIYCYSEQEKQEALKKMGKKAQITRFKGLGEISPDEFGDLILEESIRLSPVSLRREDNISDLLPFYMGKNTPERQTFIIENLVSSESLGL